MADADPPTLDLTAVTQALRELVATSHETSARLARVHDFNLTDALALEVLDRRGPLGAAELARSLGIRSASATILIDRLEAGGYVERRRDAQDRRRVTVVARRDALEANLALWAPSILALDAVARELGEAEREVVLGYLTAVTAALARGGGEVDG